MWRAPRGLKDEVYSPLVSAVKDCRIPAIRMGYGEARRRNIDIAVVIAGNNNLT